jgi:hypothetical protein
MDEDATHHPDRSLNEPQEMSHNQRERSASLAQGQNGGDDVTGNGNAVDSPTGLVDPNAKAVEDVVNSEVRINGRWGVVLCVWWFEAELIVCGRLVFLRC